jgi:hypothetical protein
MSALVISNNLPAQIPVMSHEALAKAQELVALAGVATVEPTAASLEQANALYRAIDKHGKDIAAARLELTRPIDALKSAVMEAERQATIPLTDAKVALGARIVIADSLLRKEIADAERKAREEAESKARAERERLEKERQELIAKQQAERAKAEQLAKDEAAMFGVEAEPLPPVEEPPPVVIVPVVEAPGTFAMTAPKSAVRTSTRKRLVIDDAAKIPREIAGAVLLIPDEKAIDKLLRAGVAVPGCRLESYEAIGSAGVR